ncbi:hypothetical protein GWI33_015184 [Rhynchophorus ferrugineus]|nr:hypothetical protein GWI33_015184 [Rhynchophorus ferrugineus]
MILNDRKLKLNDIPDIPKISTERVYHIIHEYMGMRKLCAKCVLRELTFNQKQRRVDDSKDCLNMNKRNKPHRFTPKSNRQLSEWTAHDEPAPKGGKKQQSAGKFKRLYFWMRVE